MSGRDVSRNAGGEMKDGMEMGGWVEDTRKAYRNDGIRWEGEKGG